jgi:signal transduction histidine kinase/ActR/RegA family two-component response regulator
MAAKQSSVLVVDDNSSVRDLLASRLERRGYVVETAVDGRNALDILHQTPFDLVLLDIMMPELNGYQVLEQLQKEPDLQHIPVIVLSALNDMNSVIKCIELGAEDYLFKPINSSLLWARITASLEKKLLRDKEQAHLAELAVLHQIDKELNTNLDENKVAQIVLKWAMQQTESDAGLFGTTFDNQLIVGAAQNLDVVENQKIAFSEIDADEVVADGRLRHEKIDAGTSLLNKPIYRVMVPVGRDGTVHGLLILENQKEYEADHLNFLTRLGDHASIALVNAHLYAKAQAANQAKSDFVALVSHELKTPLSVIMAYGDLIRKVEIGSLTEKQDRFLTAMQEGASRMHSLVMELDDITRMETGKMRMEPESVDIESAINAVIQLLTPQIIDKKQTITTNIPYDLPGVWVDHKRLLQILTNLINNANKYTPEKGHISVSAFLTTQTTQDEQQPVVQIAVADDGLGIDKLDQPMIFSQFFRSDDAQVKAMRGAGLGLNITQQIVELHGGKIWFESEYRQGTTFYFTLPVVKTAVSQLAES